MLSGSRRILAADWTGPVAVGLVALVAVLATINPAHFGPGVTVDESFNTAQGYFLTEAAGAYGWAMLHPASQLEVAQSALNDHPPLARWGIGISEQVGRRIVAPDNPAAPYSLARARISSAVEFAVLICLIGFVATRWYGRPAGWVAAISLLYMPRVFGHAHIASLESMMNLTYAAAILSVAQFWDHEAPPSKRVACLTGVLFGLALLSKVQAIFIPIPIALWALLRWRHRAIVPVAVWGMAGLIVFYAGWPHLWDAPFDHLMQYLGRTTQRIELHNWYLGQQYADRATPWHYPLVMFAITVPVGVHLLSLIGVAELRKTFTKFPRELLLLGAIALPLLVFSLPGTPIYDGVRLFLVVYPLWALFAGRGGQLALDWLRKRMSAGKSNGCLAGFLLLQAYGIVFLAPCWLSYYNLAVGGLRGADRLGLERTYWSDSVTHDLIAQTVDKIPKGSTLYVAPVLHQFQLDEMLAQEPLLAQHNIQLQPYQGAPLGEQDYLLVYYRRANLDVTPDENWRIISEVRRENVPLAGVYQAP